MKTRILVVAAVAFTATVVEAQQCPECAAADACVKQYVAATTKSRRDTQKWIADFKKGMRDLKLEKGPGLERRGVEQMEKNHQTMVRLEIDALIRCLNGAK